MKLSHLSVRPGKPRKVCSQSPSTHLPLTIGWRKVLLNVNDFRSLQTRPSRRINTLHSFSPAPENSSPGRRVDSILSTIPQFSPGCSRQHGPRPPWPCEVREIPFRSARARFLPTPPMRYQRARQGLNWMDTILLCWAKLRERIVVLTLRGFSSQTGRLPRSLPSCRYRSLHCRQPTRRELINSSRGPKRLWQDSQGGSPS